METLWWIFIGVIWWTLFGNLWSIRVSYPKNPDPRWVARGEGPAASGKSVQGLLKHALLHAFFWPLAMKWCKRDTTVRFGGHWCFFVKYPEGRYTEEDEIRHAIMAMNRVHDNERTGHGG